MYNQTHNLNGITQMNIIDHKSDKALLNAIQTTNCDLIAFEFLDDSFDVLAPQSHECVVSIRERVTVEDFVELFNETSTVFANINTVLKAVDSNELLQYIDNLQKNEVIGSFWYRVEDCGKLYHVDVGSYCNIGIQTLLNSTAYIQRINTQD